MANNSNETSKFHLLQYELIKKEMETDIQEMRSVERYALLVTGAVWTYFASDALLRRPSIIWWIPFLLVAFGALRSHALVLIIRLKAEYLRKIETELRLACELKGFALFWEEKRSGYVGNTPVVFWGLLLLITLIAPFFVGYFLPTDAARVPSTQSQSASPALTNSNK